MSNQADPVLAPPRPQIAFVLAAELPSAWRWLYVVCGWCGQSGRYNDRGYLRRGCLLCGPFIDRVDAVCADPAFRALRAEAAKNPAVLEVLLDWLADHGLDVREE